MAKRLIDIIVSLSGLILLSPLLAATALVVRLKLGTPVLFCQQRPGWHGKPFFLYKFRTMTDGRDSTGNLLPDDDRQTRTGRLLRSSSLDELPELWNVLRGDMSLVGPRPLLMDYLDHYTAEQQRRHDVRPGLTGWAQINGRADLDWDQKLALDIWYVEHASLWLDLKILLLTPGAVLGRRGTQRTDNGRPPAMQAAPGSTP
jgi:sugar transferase EpsL